MKKKWTLIICVVLSVILILFGVLCCVPGFRHKVFYSEPVSDANFVIEPLSEDDIVLPYNLGFVDYILSLPCDSLRYLLWTDNTLTNDNNILPETFSLRMQKKVLFLENKAELNNQVTVVQSYASVHLPQKICNLPIFHWELTFANGEIHKYTCYNEIVKLYDVEENLSVFPIKASIDNIVPIVGTDYIPNAFYTDIPCVQDLTSLEVPSSYEYILLLGGISNSSTFKLQQIIFNKVPKYFALTDFNIFYKTFPNLRFLVPEQEYDDFVDFLKKNGLPMTAIVDLLQIKGVIQ